MASLHVANVQLGTPARTTHRNHPRGGCHPAREVAQWRHPAPAVGGPDRRGRTAIRHTTEDNVMKTTQFDRWSKALATGTTRRQALAGVSALVLGGAGFFGVRSPAAADKRDKCHQRCRQRASRKPHQAQQQQRAPRPLPSQVREPLACTSPRGTRPDGAAPPVIGRERERGATAGRRSVCAAAADQNYALRAVRS